MPWLPPPLRLTVALRCAKHDTEDHVDARGDTPVVVIARLDCQGRGATRLVQIAVGRGVDDEASVRGQQGAAAHNLTPGLIEPGFYFISELKLIFEKVIDPGAKFLNFGPRQPRNGCFNFFHRSHK